MKLPRLQLYLSTCILLMFVAGGLIWANVQTFDEYPEFVNSAKSIGWPFVMQLETQRLEADKSVPFHPIILALNVLIGLGLLFSIAKIAECRPFQFHLSTALAFILVTGGVLTLQVNNVHNVEHKLGWRNETDSDLHERRLGRKVGPDDRVFLSPMGRPIHDENLRDDFYEILEAAKIPRYDHRGRSLDLHAARTTVYARGAAAGIPADQMMTFIGHKDIRTAMRHYHDPNCLDTQRIAAKLAGMTNAAGSTPSASERESHKPPTG